MRTWLVVAVGAVLTLARFSEAFLVLRALDLGFALAMVPIVLVVMNVAYTATAYPAGVAADRGHRKPSWSGARRVDCLGSRDASSASWALFFAGVVLWGLHMGLTQGLLSTLVADAAPADAARLSGVPPRVRSRSAPRGVIAGVEWDAYGPAWTFYAAPPSPRWRCSGCLRCEEAPEDAERVVDAGRVDVEVRDQPHRRTR